MKKIAALFLLLALFLGLAACDRLVMDDYYLSSPHSEQPSQQQEPQQEDVPPTVTNRTELRGAMLSFIRDWTEQGTILISRYSGNVSEDLQETLDYVTREDPMGAYAVDYMDAEFDGTNQNGSISVNIVFRRSAAEMDAIITVNGNSVAYAKIQQALIAYDSSLTLRIRNYQPTDFEAYIQKYCIEHPETIIALPVLSAEVYPSEGETRILELHFSYPVPRDEMRMMQTSVSTILSSATSYIRSGQTDLERAELLYRFLTTRFDYSLSETVPTMPAYSLLCEGIAHGLSFASVFYAQCESVDIDCIIVSGQKDGQEHYWNLLRIEEEYYHVDLM
ncbi:MAG: transglutaminase domain-containing protein, partial [Oscillospiraceae bacterium]|nr:transglutaminase domain-containing protein [Oscillospiraceae bacterium]